MKRLIYTFALFFVSLFAMAWDIADGSYIYFSNTNNWNNTTIQFMIGHNSWSEGYAMTSISNTKLYYVKMPAWGGYGQWAIIGADGVWGGEGKSVKDRAPWAPFHTSTKEAELKKYSIIYADVNFATNSNTNGYSSLLNKTHTIKTQLDNTDNANVGDVSTTYYELTAVSTATKKTPSITSSGTISVVYTSQVTLEATPADGYVFVGWYEGSTCKETALTYTYIAENSTKTVIAKFIKLSDKYIYLKPNSNWKQSNARFVAYFFGGSSSVIWMNMTDNNKDGIYECKIPEGYTQVIFCRMNPKFNENGWNQGNESDENKKVWNQTSDLIYDGSDKNIYVIADGEWDKGAGYWMSFGGEVGTLPSCDKYVRGSFNDWGITDKMTFDVSVGENGRFACTKILQSGTTHEFKIADENWVNIINTTCNQGECDIILSQQTTGDKNVICTLEKKSSVTFSIVRDKETYDIYLDYTDVTFDDNTVFENAGYGKFTYKKTISGSEVNKWHWISLPYDVNVADIKSNVTAENPYRKDFIMKRYATEVRADWAGEKPTAVEDNNTWAQLETTDILKAGRGYILGVNNDLSSVTLTFPANGNFHVVTDQVDAENENIKAKSQELDINSNWHLIGTGLYGETGTRGGANPVNYVAYPTESGSDYTYYYLATSPWPGLDDAFIETQINDITRLEKYKAFFVQHSGEYSFSKASTNQSSAPRRAPVEELIEQYYINIVGEKDTARTAIFLAEDGSDDYVVGKDFLHFGVTGATAQLYTKQDSRLLAFNHLKRENRVVDLGGYMVNAGEYTISMMDNGEASVVLIDSYTGESVDLTVDNYTFTTEKGSLDGRFSIAISYAEKDLNTNVGNEMAGDLVVSNNGGLIVVDGLSVGADVWIFDAVGRCVDRFVADGECHELNIGTGVYVLKTSVESVKFVVW